MDSHYDDTSLHFENKALNDVVSLFSETSISYGNDKSDEVDDK